MSNFTNLELFLQKINRDVYPEPIAQPHLSITQKMIQMLHSQGELQPKQRLLDVGCGQGLALKEFKKLGVDATGITLGQDYEICKQLGFKVLEMDLAHLEFEDAQFDFIWCRHCLEHSIFPLFTLSEFYRLLTPQGKIYIEVPATDTSCHHERNPNHYSVLGKSMWRSLFKKAHFKIVWEQNIDFRVPAGPDTYWNFLLSRS